ncbi:MAG: hypothetical protein NTX22_03915 [Ignavibacteriales bacterium]|nr:hypothetical protein [Ignavibacteriales bacterium]
MKKNIAILLNIVLLFVLMSKDSFSIPAFARKYNMTCKNCHSPFPKLKPFGEEFENNGFVISDNDAPRYFTNTGDDELSLLRDVPLAIRIDGIATYNQNNSNKLDFGAPSIIKFISGGALANNLSYYFYFIIENGEVIGLEDAYLTFNNVFGLPLNISIGQFQVSDPLFKRELRLTLEDYAVYKFKVGLSNVNLTYDRGIFMTYNLPSKTTFALEILNGNGIDRAEDDVFDKDKYKNFFGRVSQEITQNFRVGGFGYYGNEEQFNNVNKLAIGGIDATVSYNQFEFNFQYLERRDKNPLFLKTSNKLIATRGVFGELIFKPDGDDSKWYAVGLVNWLDKDDSSVPGINLKSAAFSLGYMLKRNVRLVGEFNYNLYDEYGKFGIGFVASF